MRIDLMSFGGVNGNIQDVSNSSFLGISTYSTYNAKDSLAGLKNVDPNGIWNLYFADTIGGDGNATLSGWRLNIEPVPENVALGAFGGIIALAGGRQWWLKRRTESGLHREHHLDDSN